MLLPHAVNAPAASHRLERSALERQTAALASVIARGAAPGFACRPERPSSRRPLTPPPSIHAPVRLPKAPMPPAIAARSRPGVCLPGRSPNSQGPDASLTRTTFPTCFAPAILLTAAEAASRPYTKPRPEPSKPSAKPCASRCRRRELLRAGSMSRATILYATSRRSHLTAGAPQISRLPISTICPPSPRAAREAATIPLEVREFNTARTPVGDTAALSVTNVVARELHTNRLPPERRTRVLFILLPAVAHGRPPRRPTISMAARPTPPAPACTRTGHASKEAVLSARTPQERNGPPSKGIRMARAKARSTVV